MVKIKSMWWLGLVILLVATRFVGLDWGLPYPFHPDERNMAEAVSQLSPHTYFHPHFFAYGQLLIYAAYLLGAISNLMTRAPLFIVSAVSATIALRFIAAAAAVATWYVGMKIMKLFNAKLSPVEFLGVSLLLIFSPALIQFAHFGTTEAVLILCYTLVVYHTLVIADESQNKQKRTLHFWIAGFFVGVAAAAKISSLIFALLPVSIYLNAGFKLETKKMFRYFGRLVGFGTIVAVVTAILSPYNILAWKDFISTLTYESEVARGLPVFYTRSFQETIPVVYQFINVFSYSLGPLVTILFVISFFSLPKTKNYNILRVAFLLYFLPSAFLWAKWTRFMAPIFPIMIVFVCLFLIRFYRRFHSKLFTSIFLILVVASIVPGVAYLSIYMKADVRFTASEWIYKNIPSGSYILSETANVIDLPVAPTNYKLPTTNYRYISFNFYDVDENLTLQNELHEHIKKADYIFVLSRRVFANHTCETPLHNSQLITQNFGYEKDRCRMLKKKYPILNDYYRKLFSGEMGFKKVAEFSSFPQFSIFPTALKLRGASNFQFSIPDEQSEETWTVFDHPVVRIYKKV